MKNKKECEWDERDKRDKRDERDGFTWSVCSFA